MTENKKIFYNVMATYGRSLINVACGLFTVRWVLEALGHEDYGLYGVVGGLVIFISFLNEQFSGAVSRFFAVAIGEMKASKDRLSSLENCRNLFSTAIAIHVVLAVCLVSLGYPAGLMAMYKGWIAIPAHRFVQCVWVWRFACVSCFLSMVVTPFWAMYLAKQEIVEMTLYGLLQTALRTGFIFYMTLSPGDWLVKFAFAMCIVTVLPFFLYFVGSFWHFEECRIRHRAFFDTHKIKDISSFVGWETFSSIGWLFKGQGVAIIVNNFLGAKVNAAMSVGNQLAGESAALTGALINAFQPAIVTAYGAREFDKMRTMAFRACKFGVLLILVFAIPLIIEMDEVLRLWLKTPPPMTGELCVVMIGVFIVEKFSQGHTIAIAATGKIGPHRCLRGLAFAASVPIVFVGICMGYGVHAIGLGLLISISLAVLSDLYVARIVADMKISRWVRDVAMPAVLTAIVVSLLTSFVPLLMRPSFLRICITSGLSVVAFIICMSIWGLSKDEKAYVVTRIMERIRS